MSDARHRPIAEQIWLGYNQHNDLPCPWTGKHGKLLDRLLKENPKWPLEAFVRSVRNRFASEVNLAEDPAAWISKLPSYARTPLDKFNKPLKRKTEDVVDDYWKLRNAGKI